MWHRPLIHLSVLKWSVEQEKSEWFLFVPYLLLMLCHCSCFYMCTNFVAFTTEYSNLTLALLPQLVELKLLLDRIYDNLASVLSLFHLVFRSVCLVVCSGSFCSVVLVLSGLVLHSAGVNSDCVLALLAADWAAPGKLAGAALYHLSPACSVSWPATHQLASIWSQPRGSWDCVSEDSNVTFSTLIDKFGLSRLFFSDTVLRFILPLHLLPAVPGIPLSGSRLQKSGEGARYTRSLAAGGLTWGSRGSRAVLDPIRVRRT